MPAQVVPQSVTVDYTTKAFDGISVAPAVIFDGDEATEKNATSQIYEPDLLDTLGVINLDLSGTGETAGAQGPRCLSQLFVFFPVPVVGTATSKAFFAVKASSIDTPLWVPVTSPIGGADLLDMNGQPGGWLPSPVIVPQGAILVVTGPDLGGGTALVRITVDTPADPCALQLLAAIAANPSPPG